MNKTGFKCSDFKLKFRLHSHTLEFVFFVTADYFPTTNHIIPIKYKS